MSFKLPKIASMLLFLVGGAIATAHRDAKPALGQTVITPTQYLLNSSTSPSGSLTCGPAYSVPSPAPGLYCKSYAYGGTNTLCPGVASDADVYVAGGNSIIPYTSSSPIYWASPRIGGQFLYVTWQSGTMYVTSLMPSQTFNIIVSC